MKILQVITSFQLGGAEDFAIAMAIALRRRGHDSRVVAVRPCADPIGQAQKRYLAENDVPAHDYPWKSRGTSAALVPLQLAKVFRKWRPDIVHSHTDIPDLMVGLASRMAPVKLARSIQNSSLWPTRWLVGGIAELVFRDDLVIACSKGAENAYQQLRRRYGLRAASIRMVPNGIDWQDETARETEGIREQLGIDSTKLQFLFAGRFVPQKGFDILLDALASLPPATRARFDLHAFGSGDEEADYKKWVAAEALPVIFHAPIDRIARIYRLFDALIMPSRFDGLSLVGAGVLAAGVPIVTTTAMGAVETVPPDWPLLCPVGDSQSLARMIERLVDGEVDLRALGKIGAAWARERFSLEAVVDSYEQAYRETCAAADRPLTAGTR
jgi:glycosyltransferase involved in cell wall biosynthesis